MTENTKTRAKYSDIVSTSAGKINLKKALSLRIDNKLSYAQIAKQFNVNKGTLYKALKPFIQLIDNPEALNAYNHNRPAILQALEMEIATNLATPDRLKKATLGNMAYALDKITHARRLEEGQSTENIAILNTELREIDKELADLDRQLGV